MITVHPAEACHTLTPEFHLMRLLGHCAPLGAHILPLCRRFASHAVAFSFNHTLGAVLHNPLDSAQTLTLAHGPRTWSLSLAPGEIQAHHFSIP